MAHKTAAQRAVKQISKKSRQHEVEAADELELSAESGQTLDEQQEQDDDSARPTRALPLQAQVSSLLFVSPRPLDAETLAELTRHDTAEVEAALQSLKALYQEEVHGFILLETGGAWQLRTGPDSARVVQRMIPARSRRLSRAAAETLAVVAYKQPVQRAEIEAIRGVDALPTLRTLVEARLIRIVGRESTPGHPALYGTTNTFLEKFGLGDLSDLPTVREIVELAEDPGESAPQSASNENQYSTSEHSDFQYSAPEDEEIFS